ncbi:MAG: DNA polymerase III subunit epsilon [Brachymonas sp.]|jgi:DNA polymerase-3 subunit epsilon|nr:DNA polymerase III subunit epsilon [Brachymonas sp.]
MRQIVLDTETTGLEVAEGHRIIEIGCVELVNRQPTGRDLHLYINPQRAIDAGAQAVHGITAEFLVDKPVFAEIAGQFLAFIQGADEVIIHNATFDTGFLDQELQLARFPVFASHVGQVVDSLALAKSHYPGKRNSLDALCERLEVNNTHRTLHGALLDARLLAEVYIRLTRGQKSLMIEGAQAADAPICAVTQDYSDMMLPVVMPSEAECVAHAAMLEVIDKASSGKTLWKLAVAPDDPA